MTDWDDDNDDDYGYDDEADVHITPDYTRPKSATLAVPNEDGTKKRKINLRVPPPIFIPMAECNLDENTSMIELSGVSKHDRKRSLSMPIRAKIKYSKSVPDASAKSPLRIIKSDEVMRYSVIDHSDE